MEVVASLSQGRTAAAQCGLFTHKSVPVIFEPPCMLFKEAVDCYECAASAIEIRMQCASQCRRLPAGSPFK